MVEEARRPRATGRQTFEIHDRRWGVRRRLVIGSRRRRRRRRRASVARVLGSRRGRAPDFGPPPPHAQQNTPTYDPPSPLEEARKQQYDVVHGRPHTTEKERCVPLLLPLDYLPSSPPVPPRRPGGGGGETSSSTACTARSIRSSHAPLAQRDEEATGGAHIEKRVVAP